MRDALVGRSNNKHSARYFSKTSLEIIAAVPAELADFPRSLFHSGSVRSQRALCVGRVTLIDPLDGNPQIRWGRYYHGCGEIHNPQTYRHDQSRWFPAVCAATVFLFQVADGSLRSNFCTLELPRRSAREADAITRGKNR